MRYFFDTEFIEDGKTIDLMSIGIVAEDGREYYAQNWECDFSKANDWVKENVFPHIVQREPDVALLNPSLRPTISPWRTKLELKLEILAFVTNTTSPEFWAYYAAYDWVVLCQLFGRMIDLPKGWPMFCWDIKQEAAKLIISSETLHKYCDLSGQVEHSALEDAKWNKRAFEFLCKQSLLKEVN